MATLTASQLKQRLAELLEKPKKETDNILWALEQICVETVKSAGSLTLPGIGKLDCKVQASRKGRNPATGESITVPAKVAVKFRVAKPLKDAAPSLKSKKGKALLEEVEKEATAKRKRKREREAEAENGSKKKKGGSSKASTKKKQKAKATSGRKGRY